MRRLPCAALAVCLALVGCGEGGYVALEDAEAETLIERYCSYDESRTIRHLRTCSQHVSPYRIACRHQRSAAAEWAVRGLEGGPPTSREWCEYWLKRKPGEGP